MTTQNGNEADYRLPRGAIPSRYELTVAPDVQASRFSGRVAIDLEVVEAVDELVVNAAELEVTDAWLLDAGGRRSELGVSLDEEKERVVFIAGAGINEGSYRLECAFGGILNDKLRGFYRSTFTDPDGTTKTLATTHFESHDARRAFPCFDEPDLKAVFSIALEVPDGLFAVSNEAELSVTDLEDGRRRVQYADTIPMSTYLVCYVVGPLEASKPVDAGGTPLRVVTPIGKQHLTPFAIEVAVHALGWYTEYFGLPYPASKLDLVDVPDFAQGAMENLGCVTFRETDLLCDEETSSIVERSRIAEVIEHEIAHMWFGDLVTMKWWNGIWLNEAFATFMSICCLDDFRPEWRRWVSFGREKDYALQTDALHSTRAIEFPVRRPDEAEAMFDTLTYLKGGSVLRMLEQYLGRERFREGVRRYLAAHQYGNTETTDLWDAIEQVAGGEPVRPLMDSWILQGGFPLVTARRDGDEIELVEEPFSYLPSHEHEAGGGEPSGIGRDWIVPIRLAERPAGVEPEQDGGPGRITAALLGPPPQAAEPLRLPVGAELAVVNAGGSGTYRIRYQGPLFEQVASSLGRLTALERFNLVSDTWASTLARISALDDFLALARRLKGELDPNVWSLVTGACQLLDLAVAPEDRPALEELVRALFAPELARVGFTGEPGEVAEIPRCRASFIGVLGTIGADDDVRARSHELFGASQAGDDRLPADTAEAILQVVAWSGGRTEFDAMHERVSRPIDPLDQWRHMFAMAWVQQAELVRELQEMALSEIRSQDAPYVIRALLANRGAGESTWRFITTHWDELHERFATHAMPSMLGGISRLADIDDSGNPLLAGEVRAFLAEHPLGGHQRVVDQYLERLAVNLNFVREHRPTLGELLAKA
jgi:puromycin-sensitive aminopeptidase